MARDSLLVRALGLGTPAPVAAVEDVFAQRWTELPARAEDDNSPMSVGGELEALIGAEDPVAMDASQLEVIFASIRDGDVPWDADDVPENIGTVTALLSELDRVWQNAA